VLVHAALRLALAGSDGSMYEQAQGLDGIGRGLKAMGAAAGPAATGSGTWPCSPAG